MVSDDQWRKIEPLLRRKRRKGGKTGRPAADDRACFEGILWVLRVGARWRDLPPQYPSGPTCWRRLRQWEESGALLEAWRKLLSMLDQRGLLHWQETFMDGSFAPAKRGLRRRSHQARQGDEVDGTGRWPRYSSGSTPGVCLAPRVHPRRSHARAGEGATPARTAAHETGSHCGR